MHPTPPPLYFLFSSLNPAEKNYDVGNWELLAIKLALEEWRHWLEWLAYIQSAKYLNSRQAQWALFFGRFSFTLTYLPTT